MREHMTGMRDAFLTLETIPDQLGHDGDGTVYAVREMGRVRFQLEFGELLEVLGVLFVPRLRDSKLSIPTLEGVGYMQWCSRENTYLSTQWEWI